MLTNKTDLGLSMAVWLASDNYDHTADATHISCTQLLKPIKSLVLSSRLINSGAPQEPADVMDMVPSRMGTAIHDSIEAAWLNKKGRDAALERLGFPQKVIDRILVNPSADEIQEDSIPVYLENRTSKEILGFTISGKYDFIIDSQVEDFKTTGTYTYVKQSKVQDYILQGSIYRWLNPDIIHSDNMTIQYLFTNWNAKDAAINKDGKYPSSRVLGQTFQLLSLAETENYIRAKLNQIVSLADADQNEIPACTPEELGMGASTFKYYKDPTKTARSTKNFSDAHEAYERLRADGNIGIVKEVKDSPFTCKYCPAVHTCYQAQSYIGEGILSL